MYSLFVQKQNKQKISFSFRWYLEGRNTRAGAVNIVRNTMRQGKRQGAAAAASTVVTDVDQQQYGPDR